MEISSSTSSSRCTDKSSHLSSFRRTEGDFVLCFIVCVCVCVVCCVCVCVQGVSIPFAFFGQYSQDSLEEMLPPDEEEEVVGEGCCSGHLQANWAQEGKCCWLQGQEGDVGEELQIQDPQEQGTLV